MQVRSVHSNPFERNTPSPFIERYLTPTIPVVLSSVVTYVLNDSEHPFSQQLPIVYCMTGACLVMTVSLMIMAYANHHAKKPDMIRYDENFHYKVSKHAFVTAWMLAIIITIVQGILRKITG